MKRLSQTVERVRYQLSKDEVSDALYAYMNDCHNIVLPRGWACERHEDGGVTVLADYITE